VLPLDDKLIEFLETIKTKQIKNREFFGDSYSEDYLGYVCVNNFGVMLNPGYVSDTFTKILKRNNLNIFVFMI